MKLSEAHSRYLEESGTCKTPASRRTYQQILRRLQTFAGDLELDQFKTDTLTKFCNGTNLSPNTVKSNRAVVRSFFEWSLYMKFCKHNPSSDLKFTVRPGNSGVRQHNWLTEDQVVTVLRSQPNTIEGQRARVVLALGFMCGLRRAEIGSLRWSSLSADMSRIMLTGKGQKLAQIGVPPQVRQILQEWRKEAPLGAIALVPQFHRNKPGTPVWDEPMGRGGIATLIQRCADQSAIPFRPHDMRRSYAGILETKGVPVGDISRALRHSNIGVTSTYLDRNPNKAAALADTFTIAL
jgi:integrase